MKVKEILLKCFIVNYESDAHITIDTFDTFQSYDNERIIRSCEQNLKWGRKQKCSRKRREGIPCIAVGQVGPSCTCWSFQGHWKVKQFVQKHGEESSVTQNIKNQEDSIIRLLKVCQSEQKHALLQRHLCAASRIRGGKAEDNLKIITTV